MNLQSILYLCLFCTRSLPRCAAGPKFLRFSSRNYTKIAYFKHVLAKFLCKNCEDVWIFTLKIILRRRRKDFEIFYPRNCYFNHYSQLISYLPQHIFMWIRRSPPSLGGTAWKSRGGRSPPLWKLGGTGPPRSLRELRPCSCYLTCGGIFQSDPQNNLYLLIYQEYYCASQATQDLSWFA